MTLSAECDQIVDVVAAAVLETGFVIDFKPCRELFATVSALPILTTCDELFLGLAHGAFCGLLSTSDTPRVEDSFGRYFFSPER